ncbi:MAG: DUF1549 and DUF1553 domain-containing protein [Planctomycetota bacterium]|nr:DUF1549 and DUF1553 domain-containing protein [Planctomycetota bacterium]
MFRSRILSGCGLQHGLLIGLMLGACGGASAADFVVHPQSVSLNGRGDRQQLLVSETATAADVTRIAKYQSLTPEIVTVNAAGVVTPIGDGVGRISVMLNGATTNIEARVQHGRQLLTVDFERDVIPIFSRFGCNAGACHGKQNGQNGFQLSLLGFDANFDFDALAKEARGRRVFLPDSARSLLLRKATGDVPHGGGKRLERNGLEYNTLKNWIESGMPRRVAGSPKLLRITVHPTERIMKRGEEQQIGVTAHYADQSTRDVTHLAAFQSNESPIAGVNDHGLATAGQITGEAAIMARFSGMIAVCNIAVPMSGSVPPDVYAKLPRYNFIDGHVWNKLQRLGITPSKSAPDHKFLRRAFIDVVGRAPTIDETKAFLADKSPDKRVKLIDHLLELPDFGDHWANKWVDLLRPNAYRVGIKNVLNYDAWIRDKFRRNVPYDEFVRELLTAKGDSFRNGAVTLFRDRRSPPELTTMVSQLFLGIRLECARCHHHPFEVWGQDDFYSFAAYFAQIGRKGTGLSPPISGSAEMFFPGKSGSVTHPLTGEVLPPRPLFGIAPEIGEDPREALAAWITSKDNPFFAQVMANRVWADIMGRGIVEPVDDLRGTNPPSNEPLLVALGEDFRDQGFDIKKLIRRITTSYAYGLSSLPSDRNLVDTRNYSRHYRQRLRAEVLLDTVVQITGIEQTYSAMPPGSMAKQIWTHRIESEFLDAFGRPDPNQDPPCERTTDTSIVQALHLMNSKNLYLKVTSDTGKAAKLAASAKPIDGVIEEIYLLIYSRYPDDEERAICRNLFDKDGMNRRQIVEDLIWALLNTPEFVFKD